MPDGGTIHLRGLHYRISSSGSVLKPDGLPYENNDDDWLYLERVAKTARWLEYVPFERISDARNGEPMLFAGDRWHHGDSALSLQADADLIVAPELVIAERQASRWPAADTTSSRTRSFLSARSLPWRPSWSRSRDR